MTQTTFATIEPKILMPTQSAKILALLYKSESDYRVMAETVCADFPTLREKFHRLADAAKSVIEDLTEK